MSDIEFVESLVEEHINWRISELALIKKIYIRLDRDNEKKFFLQTTIPIIYAIWEGFIKSVFKSLFEFLHSKDIVSSKLSYELLALSLEKSIKSLIDSKNFEKRKKHSENLIKFLQNKTNLREIKINTKSNLNSKILLEIYAQVGLNKEFLSQNSLDTLEKLVRDRNLVSHGDKSGLVIEKEKVEKYMILVQELMNVTILSIDDFLKKENYLL